MDSVKEMSSTNVHHAFFFKREQKLEFQTHFSLEIDRFTLLALHCNIALCHQTTIPATSSVCTHLLLESDIELVFLKRSGGVGCNLRKAAIKYVRGNQVFDTKSFLRPLKMEFCSTKKGFWVVTAAAAAIL